MQTSNFDGKSLLLLNLVLSILALNFIKYNNRNLALKPCFSAEETSRADLNFFSYESALKVKNLLPRNSKFLSLRESLFWLYSNARKADLISLKSFPFKEGK